MTRKEATLIYDDQPQMVEAIRHGIPRAALYEAFAAIDREVLIEKACQCLSAYSLDDRRIVAERVLIAAGIIEERGNGLSFVEEAKRS